MRRHPPTLGTALRTAAGVTRRTRTAKRRRVDLADHQSEASFTKAVLDTARLYGWRSAHFRPGMNRRGKWQTAVQGDGAGFPDVILLRGGRIVVAELKVGRNTPTPAQVAWLDAFEQAGVITFVWRPTDWNEIEAILR